MGVLGLLLTCYCIFKDFLFEPMNITIKITEEENINNTSGNIPSKKAKPPYLAPELILLNEVSIATGVSSFAEGDAGIIS